MAWPSLWRKTSEKSKEFKKVKIAVPKNRIIKEVKGKVDIPKTFRKDIGEDHPTDFELLEKIYKKVPIIAGAINKTVDVCVSSDFVIKSDNILIQKELNALMKKINFDLLLRNIVKDMMIFGNAFVEITYDGFGGISELTILNPKSMYVKRNEEGVIEGFTQYMKGKVTDKQNFVPKEIAHFAYNIIGDCAYGYSIIAPLVQIIENKLNMEKAMMTLMERKANAPIHIKAGTPEEPCHDEDITALANELYYLREKTEWVTDHRVDIGTIDFAGKIMNFAPYNEHFENQLVYGLEVPIVLLGRGAIPEGLARVQLEAFARRINSIRLLLENVIENKIFKRVISSKGLQGKAEFEWEPQAEEDKWAEVERLANLLHTNLSPNTRMAIEQKIVKLLKIELPKQQLLPQQPYPYQQQPLPQFGQMPMRPPQYRSSTPTAELLKKKEAYPFREDQRLDITIEEWVGRKTSPIYSSIQKFLKGFQFGDIDLPQAKKERLKKTMLRGMKDNVTIGTLTNRINNIVGDKLRAEKIARTESVRAHAEGLLLDFEDKLIEKVKWTAIPDTHICTNAELSSRAIAENTAKIGFGSCDAANGKTFTITEARGKIPLHPNCRCSWFAVI